jgi:hypothetical protein
VCVCKLVVTSAVADNYAVSSRRPRSLPLLLPVGTSGDHYLANEKRVGVLLVEDAVF